MRRTRSAEAAASLLGVALLVALPLASTSGALVVDGLVTTTSSILPAPLAEAVTTVVATFGSPSSTTSSSTSSTTSTSTTSTTTTTVSGAGTGLTTTTVAAAPTEGRRGPVVATAGPVTGATVDRGPAGVAAPAGAAGGAIAASPPIGGDRPDGAATAGAGPAVDDGPEAAVHRELSAQLAVGRGATGGGGLRSTDALFDSLAGLRLAPIQVARLVAPFPVAGRATYTDDWGQPRHGPGDLERRHEGVDVFADRGVPVVASADGVVSRMTADGALSGRALRLTSADGTYYLYAHLDRFAGDLEDGDEVAKGQVLGFVGNTGNAVSTPPHLHFEIHPRGGAAVPPVPYLDRWLAEAAQSVAALAAAPAGARADVLREMDAPQGSTPAIAGAAEAGRAAGAAGAVGRDLGPLRTIATARGFGVTGLLLVVAVAAWALRRWARARTRDEPVVEGWTMVDLATLARPDAGPAPVPEPAGHGAG